MSNFWNNIARSTVRDLAKAAGLRTSNEHAVADLTATYGPLPTAEFVNEFWFVLRDGWLVRSASHREAVVAKMLALGRGSANAKTKTRAGQLAYLRSIKRSPAMLDAVLEVLLESGATERAEPVFVEAPATPEAQQERFNAALAEGLRRLTPGNIETLERMLHAAASSAMAGVRLPVEDSMEAAAHLAAAVTVMLILDETWEPADTEQLPYQRVVVERAAARAGDAQSVGQLLGRYVATLRPAFQDPEATQESIARWASAVFLGALAFDGPDDAPEGFVNEIMIRQHRFASAAGATAESGDDESAGPKLELDEALLEAMTQVPNSSRPTVENGSLSWTVYAGSAVVSVSRLPIPESGPAVIRFLSPLLQNVPLSDGLLDTLNRVTGNDLLHKVYWHDGVVVLEYCFGVDVFSERLFHWTLAGFLGAADHFDTALNDRFGGSMAGNDQRAAFDA